MYQLYACMRAWAYIHINIEKQVLHGAAWCSALQNGHTAVPVGKKDTVHMT